MKIRKTVAFLLAAVMVFTLLPSFGYAAETDWTLSDGWQLNDDGSVSHLSGGKSISPRENINNSEGFSLSLDMTINSCDWEMFSTVYKLEPVDGSSGYYYMRIKQSHDNWCVEMQFYDGSSWYELSCDEGAYGQWVTGLADTVSVRLEHPAGSQSFRIAVGPEYANIVGGEMYIPQMEQFISAGAYQLKIHTEYPDTDLFTLSNYSVNSLAAEAAVEFPEPNVYDVAQSCTVSGRAGETVFLRFACDTEELRSGDFMLHYDSSKLQFKAVSSDTDALLTASGEPGMEILSFAGLNSAPDGVFMQAEFTLLADLQGEAVEALGKNLRNQELISVTTENAYALNAASAEEPACEHDFVYSLEQSVPASCTEAGEDVYVCSKCGETKTEKVEALGHDYVLAGENYFEQVYACSRCGDQYTAEKATCAEGGDCPSASYVDVPAADHWAHAGIDFVVAEGLMNGVGYNRFAPDDDLTRAMLVTVLWRMEGTPEAGTENGFTDVPADKWYTEAVSWAASEGIVNGISKDQFAPDVSITREQIATIFYRYAKAKGYDVSIEAPLDGFADADQVSSYARAAFAWAAAEGIIKGQSSGNSLLLAPAELATRAEAATILMRFSRFASDSNTAVRGVRGVKRSPETAADNWILNDGWTASVDGNGNLTISSVDGCGTEAFYRQNNKFDLDSPIYITYDVTLKAGATHFAWIKDMYNETGWGHYLLKFTNNNGTLGLSLQFADTDWRDATVTPDIYEPAITGQTLRIRYEKAAGTDGIILTVLDTSNGKVLYKGTLVYHVGAWTANASWLALSADQGITISNIESGVPTAEAVPEAGVEYEKTADNWTVNTGWSAGTDSNGNLTLTSTDATTTEILYRQGNPIELDSPVAVTYDITLPAGTTHAVWIKDFYDNVTGWGHYLLRFTNNSGTLGMSLQFADTDWRDATVTPEILSPAITNEILRIRYEKAADTDGIILTVSDAVTGTVLYKGTLVYHVGAWIGKVNWLALSADHGVTISNIASIYPEIPVDPAPEENYETDTTSFNVGSGWSADNDADGDLTLTCDASAGGISYITKSADATGAFSVSYDLQMPKDQYTSQAIFVQGFLKGGVSGLYLFRVKNDRNTLVVEAQFNNGDWINGVLETISSNPAISGDTIRVRFEKAEGVDGLRITVSDKKSNILLYEGVVTYHEDNGWDSTQLTFQFSKDAGNTSYTMSKICLDIPCEASEKLPLDSVGIKTPGEIVAGVPTVLYAVIEPYAADLVSTAWTLPDGTVIGTYKALYHTFEEAGDYLITFKAADSFGNSMSAEITVTVIPQEEQTAEELKGDINGDSVINSTDLLLLLASDAGQYSLREDELSRACEIAELLSLIAGENGVSQQFRYSAVDEFLSYMNDMQKLPVSFTYGDVDYYGFNADFNILSRCTVKENDKIAVTTNLVHSDGKLEVRVEAAIYPSYNAYEWTLYFSNPSEENSAVLKNVNGADFFVTGDNPVFKSISGDKEDVYAPIVQDLTEDPYLLRRSVSGWATHDAFPYFNLETDRGGYMLALGWSGAWKAEFSYENGQTRYTGGQYLLETYLLPGETLRSPLMAFVKYDERDENAATNAWRDWYIDCNMPRNSDGSLIEPISVTEAHNENSEMDSLRSEQAGIENFAPVLEHGITPDYIWMDAGWYYGSDMETTDPWFFVGTNTVDANRFENGLKDITDYGAQYGMKALLWFEPEYVRTDLNELCENFGFKEEWTIYLNEDEHTNLPTYLCDLTNEDYQKWLIEHVAYAMDHANISLYRQDFNRAVAAAWNSSNTEDRQGVYENHYVQSYLAYWDTLKTIFPDLIIDSCASGGGRNDLETMRRAIILHRTDSYYTDNEYVQSMSYSLWKWLPYTNGSLCRSFDQVDSYAIRSVFAAAYTGLRNYRLYDRTDNWALAAQMFNEWSNLKWYYYGEYYPLTDWNRSTADWIGWEFYEEESDSAMVQLFRPVDSAQSTMDLIFYGLQADVTYTVADTDGINSFTATGKELMETGLTISIPNARQALVILITAVS